MQSTESFTEGRETKKRHRQPCDGELMDQDATCRFFGNIHPATLWRGIKVGRYPKPVKIAPNTNRWIRSECAMALSAIIAQRDAGFGAHKVIIAEGTKRRHSEAT